MTLPQSVAIGCKVYKSIESTNRVRLQHQEVLSYLSPKLLFVEDIFGTFGHTYRVQGINSP